MGSFGERLQRERELRGITLEEIAEATKIGTRSLRALEEEEFGALPGGIFNKGFVRAYARYLGIDEEQAVTDYLAAVKGQSAAPPASPAASAQKPVAPAARKAPAATPKESAAPAPAPAAAPSEQSRLAVAVATGAVLLAVASFALWKFYPRDADEVVEPEAAAIVSAPAASVSEESDRPVEEAAVVMATQTAAAPAEGFEVQVRAREEAWVSLTADGELVYEGILREADTRFVRARERVIFKTGNAGGVEVSQNGSLLAPLGASGQVRTVTLTAEGVRR